MKTIRIRGKNVPVSQVHAWEEDYEEHKKPILENPGASISRIIRDERIRETILRIDLVGTGGERVTLRGEEADAALAVLRSANG
jgi:hypothetical protein